MKIKMYHITLFALTAITVLSCKKDTYDPPSVLLAGKLVYNGESLQLQNNQIGYELYQYGFGLVGAITQNFLQDGSYSSLLFAGEYKLTVPNGSVPFIWKKTPTGAPDSISISVGGSGNKSFDIEVTPYYMIRTPQLSAGGGKVKATFKVEKIVTGVDAKDIDKVVLVINKTQFVSDDGNERINSTSLAGSAITDPNNINLEVDIPSIVPAQNYIFARVGVRISGLNSYIFSPVQKISY